MAREDGGVEASGGAQQPVETRGGAEPPACGRTTRSGAPCRSPPFGGRPGPCYRHAGLPTTGPERAASRRAAVTHGCYVRGVLKGPEKALFNRVVRGALPRDELQRQVVAAHVVRTRRGLKWEGESGKLSPAVTGAYAELREALAAQSPETGGEAPGMDELELIQRVEALLRSDRELLLRQLPEPVREAARAAWTELDRALQAASDAPSAGEEGA